MNGISLLKANWKNDHIWLFKKNNIAIILTLLVCIEVNTLLWLHNFGKTYTCYESLQYHGSLPYNLLSIVLLYLKKIFFMIALAAS